MCFRFYKINVFTILVWLDKPSSLLYLLKESKFITNINNSRVLPKQKCSRYNIIMVSLRFLNHCWLL